MRYPERGRATEQRHGVMLWGHFHAAQVTPEEEAPGGGSWGFPVRQQGALPGALL